MSLTKRDYYEVLGVSRDADEAAIKRFLNLDRKDLSDRAADEMRKNYPDWKQNPYVQKESPVFTLPPLFC